MEEKESRYPNAKGKVLVGNWVEQKFDDYIDGDDPHWLKRGHKCILSTSPVTVKDYISTTHATYVPSIHPVTPKVHPKKDYLERFVYDKNIQKLMQDQRPPKSQAPMDFRTETREKFKAAGFKPEEINRAQVPNPQARGEYVSFYTEHRRSLPGVTFTSLPTRRFHKSCAFSKPLHERLDDAQVL